MAIDFKTKPKTGIAAGLACGHVTTKRVIGIAPKNQRRMSKGKKLCKEVIREVVGFAPYERRIIELLKIGSAATTKRALKFAKKRLGTHRRAKKKREEMIEVVQNMRRKH